MVAIEDQTEEDFYRYAPETRFCEFIDGVVYMPSPVHIRHQEIVGFLFDLINGFRLDRGLGSVMTGPAVLRVAPNRNLEPASSWARRASWASRPPGWRSGKRTW